MEGRLYHGLRLLTSCGGGAYGDVYYCRDISGRFLAVKIISKKKLGKDWERELKGVRNYRCITENSPLLLQIYHVEEDDDSFFYTMEPADNAAAPGGAYIPDTLAYRLERGPLRDDELFDILSGIFNAVRTIHTAGFAHRDIKPDNILFVNGKPKLGDIGLMSSLASTVTNPAGTMYFFPPEQRNENFRYDRKSHQKSDLYAFGKVIYCAITANDPRNFPSWPHDLTLSVPRKYFLHLSCRLCHIEPSCRPSNILDIASELKKIEHRLKYGETAGDRVRLFFDDLRTLLRLWRGAVTRPPLRNHYLLLPGALICFGGFFYYALRHFTAPPGQKKLSSSSPSDIVKEAELLKAESVPLPDNTFQCLRGRASLELPEGWTLLDRSGIVQRVQNMTENETELQKGLKDFRHEEAFVFPRGNTGSFMRIAALPFTGRELEAVPDGELADFLRREYYGNEVKTIACKRLDRTSMGKGVIFFGKSDAQTVNWAGFIFLMQDSCIGISLRQKTDAPQDELSAFCQISDTFRRHEDRVLSYAADPDGRTPFMVAAGLHDFAAAERLLREGAKIDAPVFGGSNALHLAILDHAPETVRFLLEHGADVNAPDLSASGFTPLISAAGKGLTGITAEILKHHPDLERRDSQNCTALAWAVSQSRRECVRLLLKAGADPNVSVHREEELRTPLAVIAAVQQDPEILRMLIRAGMNLQSVNSSGENALLRLLNSSLADRKPEKTELADILIGAGIDVLRQDNEGRTALMYAAALGNEKLVRQLLAAGARKDVRDKTGKKAADYCKNPEIVKILTPEL